MREATRHSAIVTVPLPRLYRALKDATSCRSEPPIINENGPITFCYGTTYSSRGSLAIGVTRLLQTHETNAVGALSRRTGGLDRRNIPNMKAKTHDGHPPKPAGEKYLTRKEVAARFGVEVRTIDNWRSSYRMPHYHIGGQVRFVGSEVDAWAKTWRRGGPTGGRG